MNKLEEDNKFKSEIGNFIVNFSKLEYTLAYLLSFTDTNLNKYEAYIPKMMALSFDKKIELFGNYINEDLNELNQDWSIIKEQVREININRRYIAHGFVDNTLNNSHARIVRNGQFHPKKISHEDLKKYNNEISEILTGKNGIRGVFMEVFLQKRFDKWNEMVKDNYKIVYISNGEPKTQWKG